MFERTLIVIPPSFVCLLCWYLLSLQTYYWFLCLPYLVLTFVYVVMLAVSGFMAFVKGMFYALQRNDTKSCADLFVHIHGYVRCVLHNLFCNLNGKIHTLHSYPGKRA